MDTKMDQPSDPPGILFMVSRWCHHREVFRSDEGGARAALQRTALPDGHLAGIGQIVRSEHLPRASPFLAIWANQDHPRCSQYLRLTNYTVKASLQCEIDFRDLTRSR